MIYKSLKYLTIVATIIILSSIKTYSQHKIILNSGREIECEILFTDKTSVYYSFISEDGRKLNSYAKHNEIESMQFENKNIPHISDLNQEQTIDTTKFVKISSDNQYFYQNKNKQQSNKSQWVNIISASRIQNIKSQGFSVQYYGFNILEDSPVYFPMIIIFERLELFPAILNNKNIQYLEQAYFKVGITPFRKLTETLYVKFGANIILGSEKYTLYHFRSQYSSSYYYSNHEQFLFGAEPKFGLYFIPKINLGIVIGISGTVKIQNSIAYDSDTGSQLEFGINF